MKQNTSKIIEHGLCFGRNKGSFSSVIYSRKPTHNAAITAQIKILSDQIATKLPSDGPGSEKSKTTALLD